MAENNNSSNKVQRVNVQGGRELPASTPTKDTVPANNSGDKK